MTATNVYVYVFKFIEEWKDILSSSAIAHVAPYFFQTMIFNRKGNIKIFIDKNLDDTDL